MFRHPKRGLRRMIGDRHITLPERLDDWTEIDRSAEVAPSEAGLTPADRDAIWSAMLDLYRTGIYPAMTVCVRRRGRVVLNRAVGYARGLAPGRPIASDARRAQPDTPICLFSASKAILALLVHKLAEEGGVDLDAPVTRYVPEFGRRGKTHITLAEVLAHRGGFPAIDSDHRGPELIGDWEASLETVCEQPVARGDRRLAYHAFSGGFILGEVIRRVTGGPLTAYLDSRLRQPLGMRYFTYGLDGRSRGRVAENHLGGLPVRWPISRWAEQALSVPFETVVSLSNRPLFMDAVIPAGNLYATAEELSRFYQMLLAGGMHDGQRLFKAETIARATRPATAWPHFDRTLKLPMRYTEGFMLGMNPIGLYGPCCGSAYGHLGFMNILGWADPSRDLAVGLLTTGKTIVGPHLVTLMRSLGVLNRRCGISR